MRVWKIAAAAAALAVLAGAISGDAGSRVAPSAASDGFNTASDAASEPGPNLPAPPELATPDLLTALDSAPLDAGLLDAGLLGAGLPGPAAAGVAPAVAPHLDDLGSRVGVAVAHDGRMVYEYNAGVPFIPASTTKLLTAAAVLTTLDPAARFTTTVVRGQTASEIVLVGGGDPLLTLSPSAAYPTPATLTELADDTVQALVGRRSITLRYDASMFGGPSSAPGWKATYFAPGDASIGRVSALAVDGGRIGKRSQQVRAADSAATAAQQFADLLRQRGVDVILGPPTQSGPAEPLAAVSSPPVSVIVEMMLASSDNDVAEVLARHVALATGRSATFGGAAAAVFAATQDLGVPMDGVRLFDGSGLSRRNAIPPRTLAELLMTAGSADRPELRPLLTGLPVAGFNGTLDDRSVDGSAGLARAKTGTLMGVNALAGVVADANGRLLVFVVLADRVSAPGRAVRALDAIAAALARCGCA